MTRTLLHLGRAVRRWQPVRFVLVGGFNALFGYAVYLLGLALRMEPELALAVATTVGAVFNYFTTARFVFGHRALNRLPAFLATYGIIYLINAGAIRTLLRSGTSPALAQAFLIPLMATISFLLFRNLVFKPGRPQ